MRVAPWVRIGVGLGAAAFGAAMGFVALRTAQNANALIHPTRSLVTEEEIRRAKSSLSGFEDIVLHSSDGLALRGWLSPGDGRGIVVFAHGLRGNRASLLPEAIVLSRRGFGVLLYDSRASGDSEGNVATWGDREQRDVEAAVDALRADPRVSSVPIALLGFSVGASAVALAAARDARVQAVILYACWTKLEREIKQNFGQFGPLSWGTTLFVMRRAGVRVDAVRPVEYIGKIAPRPLLMVAGSLDEDTPPAVTRQMFAAAGEPKEILWIPAAHHGGYVQASPVEYEARVTAFLERALGGQPLP